MSEPQDIRRRRAGRHHPRFDAPQLTGEGQSHPNGELRGSAAASWSEGIRSIYDKVVQEPLPADFVKLLDELKKKTGP